MPGACAAYSVWRATSGATFGSEASFRTPLKQGCGCDWLRSSCRASLCQNAADHKIGRQPDRYEAILATFETCRCSLFSRPGFIVLTFAERLLSEFDQFDSSRGHPKTFRFFEHFLR